MANVNRKGSLPTQSLRELIETGLIMGADTTCLQPSSIDLPITEEIYRIPGSILPRKGERIKDIIAGIDGVIAVPPGTILRKNDVHLCKLRTSLGLPKEIRGKASNKSSTGRIDLRCRLLADGVALYDEVPQGYAGDLWIEIVPKSFDVILKDGLRLNQLRLFYGDERLNEFEHRMAFDKFGLLRARDGSPLQSCDHVSSKGVTMTVDLSSSDVVGYRSKPSHRPLDLGAATKADREDYFDTIYKPTNAELILKPGEFFLLATKPRIVVPPEYAAEMVQYDANIGNLFTHFAGFFDPGFGWREDGNMSIPGNIAVLEVEVHSSATVLRDGQPICVMAYEKMLREPDNVYGSDINSNYGVQEGVKVSKYFRET